MKIFDVGLKLRLTFYLIILLCFTVISPVSSSAVSQIETRYFTIVYDENGEYTAGKIAGFCDEIYEQLLGMFDAFGDDPRVTCIVNDAVDVANGYAIYFQNTITVYATSMDFELRGQSDWLRNVFVHEMTHMVALKKAAKGPINYFMLGAGRYDRNPDASASLALMHLSQPAWFSEGVAQTGAERFGSEHWDSHRDMLLRTAWYENELLSIDNMSVLNGQTSMEAESVYNQGYSLVSFIRDRYGLEKVVEMNNNCAFYDFETTIHDVLGLTEAELFNEWKKSLDERYASYRQRTFEDAEPVADTGTADLGPVVSPDGRYLAWLSNRGRDYTITDLMLKDLSSGKVRRLVKDVDKRPSWSHDSKKLVYAKRPDRRPQFYDIFIYDIDSENERRISRQMRAVSPSFSPGDSLVVFVRNEAGNNTLAVMNSDGSGLRYLTTINDGTQFYQPSFSPDGENILFSLYRQGLDRDIAMINTDSRSFRYIWDRADSLSGFSDSTSFAENADFRLLVSSSSDERDPVYLSDGSGIIYSADRDGIFNLYRLDFSTKRHTRLTNVQGSAFSPSVSDTGEIYYSGYTNRDFSIYRTSIDAQFAADEYEMELRDYIKQPEQFSLSKYFTPTPARSRRILNAVIPTMYLGPSFIGSRFGLDVFNVGAEAYVTDLLGRDSFAVAGSIGKNLNEEAPLNNDIEILYQKRLVPITSSTYTHSPILYVNASRSLINNYIDQYKGFVDSSYVADLPDLGYENVVHDLRQYYEVADKYRHEFRRLSMGDECSDSPETQVRDRGRIPPLLRFN